MEVWHTHGVVNECLNLAKKWKFESSPEGKNGKDYCVFNDGAKDAEDARHNVSEGKLKDSWIKSISDRWHLNINVHVKIAFKLFFINKWWRHTIFNTDNIEACLHCKIEAIH